MSTPPEMIKANVLRALRLAASRDAQSDYAMQVPIAQVAAEVICLWEDSYLPEDPSFVAVFTSSEQAALTEYHRVWNAVAATAPTSELSEYQASEECLRLSRAAERALEVLNQARDDAV